MAFGIPASFTTTVPTVGTPDEVRTAILGAFQALGWTYEILGPDRCQARVGINFLTWGETMTVTLSAENAVTITSSCRGIQIFDWGKNRQNVNEFLSRFMRLKVREGQFS